MPHAFTNLSRIPSSAGYFDPGATKHTGAVNSGNVLNSTRGDLGTMLSEENGDGCLMDPLGALGNHHR